jgi:transcriptional regulator with XRE-family HTH domain
VISREQLRMARAALAWNVKETAEHSGVSLNTVTRYENGSDAYGGTLLKLRRAFEKAGLVFIDGNGEGPGVRFKISPDQARAKKPRRN